MKRLHLVLFLLTCVFLVMCTGGNKARMPEADLGWKLGAQAYTFRLYSFFEALDKIDSAGLKYVEAFPGQQIGGGIEGRMDYTMDASKRDAVLKRLKEKGIKLLAYGVVNPDKREDWDKLFAFAQAMGIENITSEPDESFLPYIEELCNKYQVNLAIHNHPNPTHYWNPDIVLNAIKGRGSRVGACADIGHWVRSGLDPVECLRKLEGRVIQLHVKDLNEKNRQAHDLIWGTGVSNIEGVLRELKRQHFKGLFSAEYEHNWAHNTPDVTASARYFREVARNLK